ncbi:hypothetical protein DC345_12145 [Paenibacillus taichungensis]|uniref:Uncharacterized protein n=1 Tax=Paenibacillus taichungensis TaxID=484184 RepID=A0A329QW40_9BACL|nr:hypothetical protein [Paenibacillus taichungensis]RAW16216.1 hypothetical protein DC345_12145 [Paenibacillus taichungensis]
MKLLQWFIKILLTVMLVSSLTLLTTGLIVQSYVKSLLASFNIQWEGQPMGLTAMFQGALGGKSGEEKKPGTGTTDQPAGAEEEHVPEDAISVMGNGTENGETGANTGNSSGEATGTGEGQGAGSGTNSSATGSSPGESSGTGTDPDAGTNAGTDSGTTTGNNTASGNSTGTASSGNDEIVVSPDDITGKKDKLPLEEKEKIFSLLMNKLPQKEMQQISGAMEGGLTEQELRDIEQVISKYLTSEEYDNLMEVLQAE